MCSTNLGFSVGYATNLGFSVGYVLCTYYVRMYLVSAGRNTFRPWTHTSDDSYMYQLSLVVATATVSYIYSICSSLGEKCGDRYNAHIARLCTELSVGDTLPRKKTWEPGPKYECRVMRTRHAGMILLYCHAYVRGISYVRAVST